MLRREKHERSGRRERESNNITTIMEKRKEYAKHTVAKQSKEEEKETETGKNNNKHSA